MKYECKNVSELTLFIDANVYFIYGNNKNDQLSLTWDQ